MPQQAPQLRTLSPKIASVIDSIRRRIRWLVLCEGVGWALFAVTLLFWISWLLDYLPVRYGYSELSRQSRVVILTATGLVVGWILYQFVLRRIFARLSNQSIAVLIERRYPQFDDGLITTVNRCQSRPEDSVEFDADMFQRTLQDAESKITDVSAQNIVRGKPTNRAFGFAGLALVTLITGAFIAPHVFSLGFERLYLLSEKKWPRECELELVGLVVKRESTIPGIVELEEMVRPVDGKLYLGRGSSVTMIVHGRQGESRRNKLPDKCWLNFERSEDGGRGSQPFRRVGAVNAEGIQTYVLDGAPLDNLVSNLEFEVAGGDDRTERFSIEVIDEPGVKTTDLECKFPNYMVDEASGRFTPRSVRWTGEAKLPLGTQVGVVVNSQQPLSKAYLNVEYGESEDISEQNQHPIQVVETSGSQFQFQIPSLNQKTRLKFYLCDQFGIVGTEPHEIFLQPVLDRPPVIETELHGIGTAVTPDVQIPIVAKVSDDFGVDKVWVELGVGEFQFRQSGLKLANESRLETVLDFRQRRESDEKFRLAPGPDAVLSLVVAASDKYDLGDQPNVGLGQRLQLDVVTPDELLRILERLEVGQRRRLEQVLVELKELRKYLERTRASMEIGDALVEPGDESNAQEPGDEPVNRDVGLRRLFAQRALLQIEKSKNEILGSSRAFDDLRLQVINNRIVGTNREQRFAAQIIGPLDQLANQTLSTLDDQSSELEKVLQGLEDRVRNAADSESPSARSRLEMEEDAEIASTVALETAAQAIDELNVVLNLLIKFETQNELLDIVRRMIKQQEALLKRTREQRQKQAFEGLLD